MAFTVQTNNGPDTYGDEARYELKDGALIVRGGDRKVTYGPSGWLRIEETDTPYDIMESIH